MNFLAHIYLSGDNDLVKIGNFMADGIHGKNFENFPQEIIKGILLHRAIDTFTDSHPVFRQSTKRLHAQYHHYSGVIVDIFYDHFLAKNWKNYSTQKLAEFTDIFYKSLKNNYIYLTDKTKNLMPYMIAQNWLLNYATIEGISTILSQMDNRTKGKSKMKNAVNELQEFYQEFEMEFTLFFDDLILFSKEKLNTL